MMMIMMLLPLLLITVVMERLSVRRQPMKTVAHSSQAYAQQHFVRATSLTPKPLLGERGRVRGLFVGWLLNVPATC